VTSSFICSPLNSCVSERCQCCTINWHHALSFRLYMIVSIIIVFIIVSIIIVVIIVIIIITIIIIIHHPSSIIHHPSSIIHHPSSIIHHPSSIIHHPSSSTAKAANKKMPTTPLVSQQNSTHVNPHPWRRPWQARGCIARQLPQWSCLIAHAHFLGANQKNSSSPSAPLSSRQQVRERGGPGARYPGAHQWRLRGDAGCVNCNVGLDEADPRQFEVVCCAFTCGSEGC
jgi:hypothetical protein